MTACGLLEVTCHIGTAWDGMLAWALSWLSINFLVGLFLGSLLGAQFGWLAPLAILLAVLARFAPRGGSEPTDIEGADAEPPYRPRNKRENPRKPLFPNAPWNRR